MTDKQFREAYSQRMKLLALMDTNEALIAFIAGAWGLQLVLIDGWKLYEPISKALQQLTPLVPVFLHGLGLIGVCCLHIAMIIHRKDGHTRFRRACIILEGLFFIYAWWSLILAHLLVPGVFIVPVYVLAGMYNFASLHRGSCREEVDGCAKRADSNVADGSDRSRRCPHWRL